MTTRNTPMKKAFFQSGSFRVPIAECFLFILAIDWVITGRIRRKPSSAIKRCTLSERMMYM